MKKISKPSLGWREWIHLPELNDTKIKAKIDTGAKTSALHAENIEIFKRRRKNFVRFDLYPNQHDKKNATTIEAPLVEHRKIKSSVGTETERPVIQSTISIGEYQFQIELTLIDRNMMGFRMLLGRDALKGFMIDPSKSFIQSHDLNKRLATH